MDRFDAMQAFARVVETGSFTKAAATLHMSKTTVTQLIQQLEARLRVRLLNRTTRKVNVTADGAAYYERVVRLLIDMDDAETSLSSASTTPRGRLRVDVPSPLARMLLIPALPEFFARYPEIQLTVGVSDRIVDIIGENIAVNRWQTADHGVNGRLNALSINLASWSNAYCQNLSGPDVCSLMAEDASTSYVFAHANNGWTRSIASASVPTLGDWGLLALTCLMVTLGWPRVRQRTAASSAAL